MALDVRKAVRAHARRSLIDEDDQPVVVIGEVGWPYRPGPRPSSAGAVAFHRPLRVPARRVLAGHVNQPRSRVVPVSADHMEITRNVRRPGHGLLFHPVRSSSASRPA
jgi:hypothetical protein